MSCGAPSAGADLGTVDAIGQAVIQGVVSVGGTPVTTASVRLLDARGEFVAEVPVSPRGEFRFFAGPGSWSLRTLVPGIEPVTRELEVGIGRTVDLDIAL